MATVAIVMIEPRLRRDAGRRLTLSVALSALAHVAAIAIVSGLLKPMLPVLGRAGQALPIEVALVGVRPIAFAAPPEAPALATELPIVPQTRGATPAAEARPASLPQRDVPATKLRFGVSVQSDASADTVSAEAPPPPGDTSVGAIIDRERLGYTQALRLAQRYPRQAEKEPRMRDPLLVPYPPRAARARAEARIAALLRLDATGQVTDMTLFPDEDLFGPTVRESLRGVRFTPAEADAKPMPYWVILEFVFSLRPAPILPRTPN